MDSSFTTDIFDCLPQCHSACCWKALFNYASPWTHALMFLCMSGSQSFPAYHTCSFSPNGPVFYPLFECCRLVYSTPYFVLLRMLETLLFTSPLESSNGCGRIHTAGLPPFGTSSHTGKNVLPLQFFHFITILNLL